LPIVVMTPRLALTVGDPAGIGPEICEKALADAGLRERCDLRVYGPSADEARARFTPGALSAEAGRASYEYILHAVRDAMVGRVDAVVTAPVNKEAFERAGLSWKGHTDLLAHLTGAPRAVMMFASPKLRVALATVHIPLRDVAEAITVDGLVETITLAASHLPWFGVPRPRLAMAGLNPHAGEHGLMGREDDEVVRPAVDRCRSLGIDIDGPFPADTLFVKAAAGAFDLVVACYHDQGLIPVKLLGFGQAVNVTLGLPIIRTSVDHGTAFDIAGQGVADAGSLIEAARLAITLVEGRTAQRVLEKDSRG
jgi:4-hydroxythreonine-4-phosphate dehydrogenase